MTRPAPTRSRPAFSNEGVAFIGGVTILGVTVGAAAFLYQWLEAPWLAGAVAILLGIALMALLVNFLFGPDRRRIRALIDSADSLSDADFSFTIADTRNDDIGTLVRAYNTMVDTLRQERQNLHQRELMLDTVLQASPLALVLTNDSDHVIYANSAARVLFWQGRRFAGMKFLGAVTRDQPAPIRDALAAGRDAMVTTGSAGEPERYHLSCSDFTLNAREHRLYLLKRLTHELNRQEVATWKKVIRLIGHELNNSLAPISSLAHSAQLLLERNDTARVSDVLATVAQRSANLKAFIEGYSRFAKLPAPRLQSLVWDRFFADLGELQPFRYEAETPGLHGVGDPEQLEQVVINLIKNALESGTDSEAVQVRLRQVEGGSEISVLDRGRGMSEEALANALLPFYSTKRSGSGLGLSLSREIVDAHGGRIGLANRYGGGLSVTLWLPNQPATLVPDAVSRMTP